jgi:hypothetical protein
MRCVFCQGLAEMPLIIHDADGRDVAVCLDCRERGAEATMLLSDASAPMREALCLAFTMVAEGLCEFWERFQALATGRRAQARGQTGTEAEPDRPQRRTPCPAGPRATITAASLTAAMARPLPW